MPGAGVDPERLGQKWRKGKSSLGRSFKVRKSQVGCRPQGALWRSQPPRASQRRLSASPHGPAHALHTLIYPHTHTRKPMWTHHTLTRPCTRRQRPCRPLQTPILHPRHTRLHTLLHLCLPCTRALTHLHATHTVHMLYHMHSTHAHAPPRTAAHTRACTRTQPMWLPCSLFPSSSPPGRRGEGAIGHLPGSWKTPSLPHHPLPPPSTPQHSSWGPPAPSPRGPSGGRGWGAAV